MRLLTTLLTVCAFAAPVAAQDANFVVFTRTKTTSTTTWTDPSNPSMLSSSSVSKASEVEWVVRNIPAATEAVIRLALVPRKAPSVGTQRVFKVNTTTPNVYATTVFGPAPQKGAVIAEDPIQPAETAFDRLIVQRAPGWKVDLPKTYQFEIRRLAEGGTGTPNPELSHTQMLFGPTAATRLPDALTTLRFPLTMTGSLHRWEKRANGIRPYNVTPQGVAIVPGTEVAVTTGTIKTVTNVTITDNTLFAGYTLPNDANAENLTRATAPGPYAVRVVTKYLEDKGYVNYDGPR